MDFQTKPLALDATALHGLSEKLITSHHHQNNYRGAVQRLNAIRAQLGGLDWASAPVFVVNGLKREELIAANSASLHECYFDALGGDGVLPLCGLAVALMRDFGSVERWALEFTALAKALGGGSGWALLSWSSREGRLVNHWAADHTQLLAGANVLLALDMYEHAYHLDFGAQAGAYVEAFMRNIRWDEIHRRYGVAVAADALALAVDPLTLGSGSGLGLASNAAPAATPRMIDVRAAPDYAADTEMVAGAEWRDPVTVDAWSQQLDRQQPVLVYCVKGLDIGRSVALALQVRGFDARFLVGGVNAWRAAGLPLQDRTEPA